MEVGSRNSVEEAHILVAGEVEHSPLEEDQAVDIVPAAGGLVEDGTRLPWEEDTGPAAFEGDIRLGCSVAQQVEAGSLHAGQEEDPPAKDTVHTAAVQRAAVHMAAAADIPVEDREAARHTLLPAAVPVEDIPEEDPDNTT